MGQIKDLLEYLLNAIKIWIIVLPWQTGLRIRLGTIVKVLKPGLHFRLPYFDSTYIQENRLRVIEIAMQTLTSKDQKTITINSSLSYSISDISKLYDTLYHPEKTLQSFAMFTVANFISDHNANEITPESVQAYVLKDIDFTQYGINCKQFNVTNFAIVRTYRLIQDNSWLHESDNMSDKK